MADRPSEASALLVGSVAVGVGAFMASGFPDPWSSLEPVFGGGGEWQAYLDLTALWVGTLALTFTGPVLLANVLRAEHRVASSRRTTGAGIAVGGLTIGYIAMTAVFPVYLYHLYVTDPSYPDGGLMLFGIPNLQSVVVAALLGWAYFAWVTVAAETDGARRAAWLMGRAAVIIQQGLVAVSLVVMVSWYLAARSGQDTPFADAAVWISGAVFLATPVLLSVASVLLIAAFAAGLSNSTAVEPDVARLELEPLPHHG